MRWNWKIRTKFEIHLSDKQGWYQTKMKSERKIEHPSENRRTQTIFFFTGKTRFFEEKKFENWNPYIEMWQKWNSKIKIHRLMTSQCGCGFWCHVGGAKFEERFLDTERNETRNETWTKSEMGRNLDLIGLKWVKLPQFKHSNWNGKK